MNSSDQLTQLKLLLPTLPSQYYRLILIAGPHATGKTPLLKELSRWQNLPYLNLNLHLSQRLLDVTTRKRPLRVRRVVGQIIDSHPEPILAVDNIELLFEPGLQQEPLALLQELSRNKSLIVAWGGSYDEQRRVLTYAEPGHPEYRRYERPEIILLVL